MNVGELLAGLAECLCRQIREDGSPEPCYCGVVPGDGVALSYAGNCDDKNGMAWVRLNTTYPASGVGSQNTQPGNCAAELGVDIELGIMRAIPIEPDGDQVSDADMLAVTLQQADDSMTLYRAVNCCPLIHSKDIIIGTYTPAGPLGGLVGGALLINVVV